VAGPEQRISVDEGLRAIAINAMYFWQGENELESIAPGKIANFTVLEQDPCIVAPEKRKNIAICRTVFESRLFQNRAN
jgi:predicted amidohydrolase YtcJ